nr:hypothetical protein [Tanacetum cinerariifolium]
KPEIAEPEKAEAEIAEPETAEPEKLADVQECSIIKEKDDRQDVHHDTDIFHVVRQRPVKYQKFTYVFKHYKCNHLFKYINVFPKQKDLFNWYEDANDQDEEKINEEEDETYEQDDEIDKEANDGKDDSDDEL